jgi:nanoRNase/pAp phosphatase (c-di-AMP/oligoRNAs hydrolase)
MLYFIILQKYNNNIAPKIIQILMISKKELLRVCRKNNVLLLTHENADLDSFCSAAMMQEFLKKNKVHSKIGVPSHINEQAQHLAFSEKISFLRNPDLCEFNLIILFDLNNFNQLGKLSEKFALMLKNKDFGVIVFDHHTKEKNLISKYGKAVIDESAVSTTELLYNFLNDADKKIGFFACIGILEDTGHFLVGNERTFVSFAECLKKSRRTYADVLSYTKHIIPDDERIAFLKAAQRSDITKVKDVIIVTSQVSFYQSAAATKLLDFGAHISLVAGKEDKGLTTLSCRAESKFKEKHKFNLVRDLLTPLQKELGGNMGGHSGAAQWKGSADPKRVLGYAVSALKKILN